jgi:hypothetical protein
MSRLTIALLSILSSGSAVAGSLTLPTAPLGPVGGFDGRQGEVVWSATYDLPELSDLALTFYDAMLEGGDYLVVRTPDGGEFELLEADDFLNGSVTTRRFAVTPLEIELVSGDGDGRRSTFTLRSVEGTAGKGAEVLALQAAAEEIYSQRRSKPGKPTGGDLVAPKVIYGLDDRLEPWQVTDARLRQLARSAAMIVNRAALTNNGNGTYTIAVAPWTSRGGTPLCAAERFRGQFNPGLCSSFLVNRQQMATAGHCITSEGDCDNKAFIFGFEVGEGETNPTVTIPEDRIYFCDSIVARALGGSLDHALVRTDRPVIGRSPLPIRRSGEVTAGLPLTVAGHPVGLPLKVAGNAVVKNALAGGNYFEANLDTYGGNSGSPVFNTSTYLVEGILVRGETDFVTVGGCVQSALLPNDSTVGFEEVSKIAIIKDQIPLLAVPFAQLAINASAYRPNSTVQVTLTDSDLATPNVTISLETTGNPANSILLLNTGTEGVFTGSLSLEPLNLAHGATIRFVYVDADDGNGGSGAREASAIIDGVAPALEHLAVRAIGGTNAEVSFRLSEAAGVSASTFTSDNPTTSGQVRLTGLTANSTAQFRLYARDLAGNEATFTARDGGTYRFRTAAADTALLQVFATADAFNAGARTFEFTPSQATGGYTLTQLPGTPTEYPVVNAGPNIVLGDDANIEVPLAHPFPIGGRLWSVVGVCSNGYLSFGGTPIDFNPTVVTWGDGRPRIVPLMSDLNPPAGGTITAQTFGDQTVFTWDNVPFYQSTPTANPPAVRSQVQLFRDGRIRITNLQSTATLRCATGITTGREASPLPSRVMTAAPVSSALPLLVDDGPAEIASWRDLPVGGYAEPERLPAGFRSSEVPTVALLDKEHVLPEALGDQLVRYRTRVRGSAFDPRDVAAFRARLSAQDFSRSDVLLSTSNVQAAFSPSMEGYEMTLLSYLPGQTALISAFDLLHTDPADLLSQDLLLDSARVDRFPLTALGTPLSTTVLENLATAGWNFSTIVPAFDPAQGSSNAQGLWITGAAATPTKPATIGIWTSPVYTQPQFREGRILRFDFELIGDAPVGETARYPGVRLRLNSSTLELSPTTTLEPNTNLPMPTVGVPVTHSLFLAVPPAFQQSGFFLAFDYVNTPAAGKDSSLAIGVSRVTINEFNPIW